MGENRYTDINKEYITMKSFKQYINNSTLMEKVSAQDYAAVAKIKWFEIGFELEVEDCEMRGKSGPYAGFDVGQIERDISNWIQGVVDYSEELVQIKNDWKEECLDRIRSEIDSAEDIRDSLEEKINDIDVQIDALNPTDDADEISKLEDKKSDLDSEYFSAYDEAERLNNLNQYNQYDDIADEFDLGYWDEPVDYPYLDGGEWGRYLDETSYIGVPSDRDVLDFVLEEGDHGERRLHHEDVDSLLFDVQTYFDESNYDFDDFEESIDRDSRAWDDLVGIIGEKPQVKANKSSDGVKWLVTDDGSLSDKGIEIVSPVLQLQDGMKIMSKLFDWINTYGVTTNAGGGLGDTGIHINMSFKGYDMKKFDWLKLLIFVEEGAIYKDFKNRKKSRWAGSIIDYFAQLDGKWDRLSSDEYFDFMRSGNLEGMQKVRDMISGGKFYGVNFTNDNRIEFRYMGGPYSKKEKETKEMIMRYAWWMLIAFNPSFKKKEYIKKVIRLMNDVGDKVAAKDLRKSGRILGQSILSPGSSFDDTIEYILSGDGKTVYGFKPYSEDLVIKMKPRNIINEFSFKYMALMFGISIKGILKNNIKRSKRLADKFYSELMTFKKKDDSMKGLKKFVLSYKQ